LNLPEILFHFALFSIFVTSLCTITPDYEPFKQNSACSSIYNFIKLL